MSNRDNPAESKVLEDWKSTAKGWRKWDALIMDFLRPVGDEIIKEAELQDDFVVLDVATGSGEPGLSVARRLDRGKVIGLDITEEMLSTAKEKAERLGVKNYETSLYGGGRFPFGPDSFDVVVCRFGVMFFPDVLEGLREMVRVVKPGRRVCVAVWGPQNETMKAVFELLRGRLGLPEEEADSPNPFRCSETGKIEALLRQAGLREVMLTEVQTYRRYDSFGQYWEFLLDMNADIATALGKAEDKNRDEMKMEVQAKLGPPGGSDDRIQFEFPALVAQAIK